MTRLRLSLSFSSHLTSSSFLTIIPWSWLFVQGRGAATIWLLPCPWPRLFRRTSEDAFGWLRFSPSLVHGDLRWYLGLSSCMVSSCPAFPWEHMRDGSGGEQWQDEERWQELWAVCNIVVDRCHWVRLALSDDGACEKRHTNDRLEGILDTCGFVTSICPY